MDPETLKNTLAEKELLAPLQEALRRDVPVDAAQTEAAWRKMAREIGHQPGSGVSGRFRRLPWTLPREHDRRAPWTLVGAAVIAVFVSVGLYVGVSAKRNAAQGTVRSYATQAGQIATVHLPDGTQVVLAPQTSLRVRAGFGAEARDVVLVGQARFTVQPSTRAPFLVRSGTITTRVLGTDFAIRHYPGERDVVVAVQSGKVATGRHTPVVLTDHMMARLTDTTATVTAGADLREYMEWTEGRLVFTKAALPEVMAVVGRWYGLTFRFADPALASHTVTGELNSRSPREEVLQNLQRMLDVRMVFEGNVVTLVPTQKSVGPSPRRTVPNEMLRTHMEVGL